MKRPAIVWVAFEVEKDELKDSDLADLCAYVLETINESSEDGSRLPVTFKGCRARIYRASDRPSSLDIIEVVDGDPPS